MTMPQLADYKNEQFITRMKCAPKWLHEGDGRTINLGIQDMKRREKDPEMRRIYKENAWRPVRQATIDRLAKRYSAQMKGKK